MKNSFFYFCALIAFFSTPLAAQKPAGMVKKTATTASLQSSTFQVLGNCGMCEKKIETAALKAGAATAVWSEEQAQLTITFDPKATSVDAVQRAIAAVGYDNAGHKAPDDVYEKLHECCHYDRSGKQ
jgi:copper chaperone CopZ